MSNKCLPERKTIGKDDAIQTRQVKIFSVFVIRIFPLLIVCVLHIILLVRIAYSQSYCDCVKFTKKFLHYFLLFNFEETISTFIVIKSLYFVAHSKTEKEIKMRS